MLSAGIPLAEPSFEKAGDWMAIDQDFQLIHRRFRSLQTKMQSLISLNTSLASLVGNRQSVLEAKRSIKEAKTMKMLTFLGLGFIPLAFTCGLLSITTGIYLELAFSGSTGQLHCPSLFLFFWQWQ
jgi:hypothetical protein